MSLDRILFLNAHYPKNEGHMGKRGQVIHFDKVIFCGFL